MVTIWRLFAFDAGSPKIVKQIMLVRANIVSARKIASQPQRLADFGRRGERRAVLDRVE